MRRRPRSQTNNPTQCEVLQPSPVLVVSPGRLTAHARNSIEHNELLNIVQGLVNWGRFLSTFVGADKPPRGCASHMLAENVHPKIVQERLGHSSIAITMDIYSHLMPNMQADAAAK